MSIACISEAETWGSDMFIYMETVHKVLCSLHAYDAKKMYGTTKQKISTWDCHTCKWLYTTKQSNSNKQLIIGIIIITN